MTIQPWEAICQAKRAARDALIPSEWRIPAPKALNVIDVPKTCGILSIKELEITETSAPELVEKMIGGDLSSYEVTLAFCKRAAIAQQLTNCLTEILFEDALKRAKEIDENFHKTGKPIGPLHGLPMSIKDNFHIAGTDATVGFTAWANQPSTEEQESEVVKVGRSLGVIFIAKTNIPTAMLVAESYNNIFGRTTNPHNRNTTSGGSSGGESALLALKGAPLGIGTDIGGSIRIPSSMAGIYGLKPSFGRFTTQGQKAIMAGQESVRSINGPMSTSLEAVEMWSKALIKAETWNVDPNVVPIPWREITLPRQLVFGIIMDDGVVAPLPGVRRGLEMARKALEAQGHKVVEFTPYEPLTTDKLLAAFLAGDGALNIAEVTESSGEPYIEGLSHYKAVAQKAKVNPPTVQDMWKLQVKRTNYVKGCWDAWMQSAEMTGTGRPFDGVISPVSPYSACPHGAFGWVAYTAMWNLCDQTSCVFPVTKVKPEIDGKEGYTGRNDIEKGIWERYDAEEVRDTPVSLQMVGLRLEEEKVLALTKVVKEALEQSAFMLR